MHPTQQPLAADDGLPTPRNAANFYRAQAVSSRRLGFSVTRACPLKCAHCSVEAGPDLGATTFGRAFAERVVAQLPALKAIGVDFLDFTGGEPTLAATFVRSVSAAARACGQSCGIVTAAHWATDPARARAFIEGFPDIDNWDISTDLHHLEFVPVERVELAFRALSDAGKPPLIRIAHTEPISYEEAVLIERVHRFADRRISFQPIGPVGRATSLIRAVRAQPSEADLGPCPTTGPLVRAGGVVAPCCAPLSHESRMHPLVLGDAFTEPLVDVMARWRVHPLLQTLRVWGFKPLFEWFGDAHPYVHILRSRACTQCVELVRDAALCAHAMQRASAFDHRVRLAAALIEYFDEHWLEDELRVEARRMLGARATEAYA